jgi:hypothetical protein
VNYRHLPGMNITHFSHLKQFASLQASVGKHGKRVAPNIGKKSKHIANYFSIVQQMALFPQFIIQIYRDACMIHHD